MRILCLCNDTLSGCELRCVRGWSFAWFSVRVKACEAAPAASKIVNFKRQCGSFLMEVSKKNFFNQFRLLQVFFETFAELRAWTRKRFNRFLQLRQPQLQQIDQIESGTGPPDFQPNCRVPDSPNSLTALERVLASKTPKDLEFADHRLFHSHGNW